MAEPHRTLPDIKIPGARKVEQFPNGRKTYPLKEEDYLLPNQKSAKEAFEKYNKGTGHQK